MNEITLDKRDIFIIKSIVKLIICSLIILNLDNYNLVILLFMIMAFIWYGRRKTIFFANDEGLLWW